MMGEQVIKHNIVVPLYKQIASIIINRIKNNELKYGEKIPSETELANEFNVSRITIRSAISDLVENGIVERRQGKGTFVCEPKGIYQANDEYGFSRSCLNAGKKPKTELLKLEYTLPPPSVKDFLNLQEDELILHSCRLRYVDNVPTLIEKNYYPHSLSFLLKEDLNTSLYSILHKHNISVVTKNRYLDVSKATKEEADLLGIKPGSPLLLFTDELLDSNGNPLYYSKQLYCAERLKFYL